jgi:tRNA(adenine34) deaminase
VVDLFAQARLNHHTHLQSGVLAKDCGALLSEFFRRRRAHARGAAQPLREDALRTPEARFADLPDYPWTGHYLSDLPALAGLRMHYLDEGPRDAPLTWLFLHGGTGWSWQWRHMIPALLRAGHRVVAPDLVGFGKSDKPKRESAHSFAWHRQVLLELVEYLQLERVVLVAHDAGTLLARSLPESDSGPYRGLLAITTSTPRRRDPQAHAACDAPFPDTGHRAAPRAFAAMQAEEGESLPLRSLVIDDSDLFAPASAQAVAQRAITHFS